MKIKVGVIFGGETVEHEVSIISAVQAMKHINEEKYAIVPIYMAKDRTWYTGNMLKDIDVYRDFDSLKKYAKKVVVRNNGNRSYVDLYFSIYASQFGKVDAILVANLYRMFEEKNLRSDLTDFISIEWYSDKAWNSEDVCHFKYDDIKFINIDIFDGNFVLTFDCNVVEDGVDLAKKFKTEEVDGK